MKKCTDTGDKWNKPKKKYVLRKYCKKTQEEVPFDKCKEDSSFSSSSSSASWFSSSSSTTTTSSDTGGAIHA